MVAAEIVVMVVDGVIVDVKVSSTGLGIRMEEVLFWW